MFYDWTVNSQLKFDFRISDWLILGHNVELCQVERMNRAKRSMQRDEVERMGETV